MLARVLQLPQEGWHHSLKGPAGAQSRLPMLGRKSTNCAAWPALCGLNEAPSPLAGRQQTTDGMTSRCKDNNAALLNGPRRKSGCVGAAHLVRGLISRTGAPATG